MNSNRTKSPYLTVSEAAEYLRVCDSQLRHWQRRGHGPRYHQPGGPGTKILYLEADLREWVEGESSARDIQEAVQQQ